jgi:hypothetical protein
MKDADGQSCILPPILQGDGDGPDAKTGGGAVEPTVRTGL